MHYEKLTETGHSPVMIVVIESVNIFDIIHKISFKKQLRHAAIFQLWKRWNSFFFFFNIRKFKGMTI